MPRVFKGQKERDTMARLPGYLEASRLRVERGRVVCNVRIRWWHPGAWLLLARVLCRALLRGGSL